MTKAVITGTYADFRIVKTRKVCQAVVEFPLEKMAEFVAMFGAPDPGAEVPVVIARLSEGKLLVTATIDDPKTEKANPISDDKPKRRLNEMPLSQQCALKCQDVNFQRWLGATSESVDRTVKWRLAINSKTELDSDKDAGRRWLAMESDFYAEQREYRQ